MFGWAIQSCDRLGQENLMASIKGTKLAVSIKTITPAVAKQMLSTTKHNRRVLRNRVLRLSQAMTFGEWTLGQPLMVNCDGTLIDGQHRLNAVVHSGKPIDFIIIEGFDRDNTFGKIDDVAARRLSHWLEIQGEPLPAVLASVVTMTARHELGLIPTGTGGASFMMTGPEGIDYLGAHPECREAVLAPGTVSVLVSRSLLCFAYLLFARKDEILAKTFLIELTMDETKARGDPIYLLRERLKTNRYAKKKLPRSEILAIIIKAWNAVRADKKLHNLRWRSTGPEPESFPEVQ